MFLYRTFFKNLRCEIDFRHTILCHKCSSWARLSSYL